MQDHHNMYILANNKYATHDKIFVKFWNNILFIVLIINIDTFMFSF
jgi:hypothetical protein